MKCLELVIMVIGVYSRSDRGYTVDWLCYSASSAAADDDDIP